jgi:hypothetical protein
MDGNKNKPPSSTIFFDINKNPSGNRAFLAQGSAG